VIFNEVTVPLTSSLFCNFSLKKQGDKTSEINVRIIPFKSALTCSNSLRRSKISSSLSIDKRVRSCCLKSETEICHSRDYKMKSNIYRISRLV
jgi:hypothetical protein